MTKQTVTTSMPPTLYRLNHSSVILAAVVTCLSFCVPEGRVQAADAPETKSALETDSQGWSDILPAADLKGWSRVPVPPTGKFGRDQWHVDTDAKVLICDGDGGHDMLLLDKEIGDAIFHFEFRYTKV